jgi:hypothetical protein
MPTPVEVTHIKRSATNGSGIEGLGGDIGHDPWYMSEHNVIWEVESGRYWDFFLIIDGRNVPLAVQSTGGRKCLTVKTSRSRSCGCRSGADLFLRNEACRTPATEPDCLVGAISRRQGRKRQKRKGPAEAGQWSIGDLQALRVPVVMLSAASRPRR